MGGSGLASLLFFLAFGLFLYWMMKKGSCGMHGHGGYDHAGYGRDDSAGPDGGARRRRSPCASAARSASSSAVRPACFD